MDIPQVLVVSDYLASPRLTRLFEREGYRVGFFGSVEEVLLYIHEEGPDLVILNWDLPEASAPALCRAIKDATAKTYLPVLIIPQGTEHRAGLAAGADDYLNPSFQLKDLRGRVKSLLRIRAAEQEKEQALAELSAAHSRLGEALERLVG